MITWVFFWLARLFYHALLLSLMTVFSLQSGYQSATFFSLLCRGFGSFSYYFLLQIYRPSSYHHHCHLTTGKYPPNVFPFFLFCLLSIFEKNHHFLRIFVSADERKSTWSLAMTVFTLGSKLAVSWICNMITHAVPVFCFLFAFHLSICTVPDAWGWIEGLTARLCKVWSTYLAESTVRHSF